MKCSKCGNECREGTKFCGKCGNPLQPEPKIEKKEPTSVPAAERRPSAILLEQPEPRKKKGKGGLAALIAGLVILLAAGGAGAAWFLFLKPNQDKEAVSEETEKASEEPTETEEEAESLEEETAAEETKEAFETEDQVPANSSQDEGNLFGNTHCYARIVSDGESIFLRNPQDQEKTYVVRPGEEPEAFSDYYMKDMHLYDGWIYFSGTEAGDNGTGIPDNDLCRISTDGTGYEKLTNMTYGSERAWLSLDTIAGGYCYFSYCDGVSGDFEIYRLNISTGEQELLVTIPAASTHGLPTVSLVDNKLYYKLNSGLYCVDLAAGEESLVREGFDCQEYMIYDGYVYYVTAPGGTETSAGILRFKLDDTDPSAMELVYESETTDQIDQIQMNTWRGRLYFLESREGQGILRSCEPDGSNLKTLLEGISWFNIVRGKVYFRYPAEGGVAVMAVPVQTLEALTEGETPEVETILAAGTISQSPTSEGEGWKQNGDEWSYILADGSAAQSQWLNLNEQWYYMDENKAMVSDCSMEIEGKHYAFNEDGTMLWEFEGIPVLDLISVEKKGGYYQAIGNYCDLTDVNHLRGIKEEITVVLDSNTVCPSGKTLDEIMEQASSDLKSKSTSQLEIDLKGHHVEKLVNQSSIQDIVWSAQWQ